MEKLIYSICYYHTRRREKNLSRHLGSFLSLDCKKELVICAMVDSYDPVVHNKAKKNIKAYIKRLIKTHSPQDIDTEITVLTSYNWGGTILGLWMVYRYAYEKYIDFYCDLPSDFYISHFEEDFNFVEADRVVEIKEILDSNSEYIYVGETNRSHPSLKGRGEIKKENNRKPMSTRCPDREYEEWTDGGFYFSNIERLLTAEKAIGIFHKGDPNTQWDHFYDGVDMGEVGFPTSLVEKNLSFGAIFRGEYLTFTAEGHTSLDSSRIFSYLGPYYFPLDEKEIAQNLPYRAKEEIDRVIATLMQQGWMFRGCGSDYPPYTEKWSEALSLGIGSKFTDGLSVIDMGCGYGRFLNFLLIKNIKKFTYYGFEIAGPKNGDILTSFNKKIYAHLNDADRKISFGFINDDNTTSEAIENCDTLLLGSVFTHIRIEDAIEVIKKYEKILEKENGSVVFSSIMGDEYSLIDEGCYGCEKTYGVVRHTNKEIGELTLNGKYLIEKITTFQTPNVGYDHTMYKLKK